MPNWCSTTFKFHGSEKDLEIFDKKITEWTSKSYTESDFGSEWLGNILYGAGLQDRIDNPDPEKYLACRGNIVGWTSGGKVMDMWVESAWVPMAKMWVEVIKVLGLNIDFSFSAEEPGCELYWNYDPGYGDFDDLEVHICIDLADEGFEEYTTEEDALEMLNNLYNLNATDLDSAIAKCQDLIKSDDDYISINRFLFIKEFDE